MTTSRRPRRAITFGAAAAACLAIPALLLRSRLFRVEVAGDSMTPALLPGDFVLLRRGPPPRARAYGQIVAVPDPRPVTAGGAGRLLLKRIVGLPGEMLRVGDGVQVNGHYLREPYAHGDDPPEQRRGVQSVTADRYFVLGDHRAASTDSRDFGAVARDQITGVALLRYWPPARAGWLRPPPRRFIAPATDEGSP